MTKDRGVRDRALDSKGEDSNFNGGRSMMRPSFSSAHVDGSRPVMMTGCIAMEYRGIFFPRPSEIPEKMLAESAHATHLSSN
jgi:hypothetical protein